MSYTDNPSARFLYAILKQKNLKDIDWNEVARDPVLAQSITNGHAARMRYSRLRSAILGSTKKPSPAEPTKFKVTKSKRHANTDKNVDKNAEKNPSIKGSMSTKAVSTIPSTYPQPRASTTGHSPTIKQEPDWRAAPLQQMSPPVVDFATAYQARLHTPSSDDMLPHTPHLDLAPGFLAEPEPDHGCDHNPDHIHFPDDSLLCHAARFPAFDAGYGLHGFESSACDHSRTRGLAGLEAEMGAMAGMMPRSVMNQRFAVKREEM